MSTSFLSTSIPRIPRFSFRGALPASTLFSLTRMAFVLSLTIQICLISAGKKNPHVIQRNGNEKQMMLPIQSAVEAAKGAQTQRIAAQVYAKMYGKAEVSYPNPSSTSQASSSTSQASGSQEQFQSGPELSAVESSVQDSSVQDPVSLVTEIQKRIRDYERTRIHVWLAKNIEKVFLFKSLGSPDDYVYKMVRIDWRPTCWPYSKPLPNPFIIDDEENFDEQRRHEEKELFEEFLSQKSTLGDDCVKIFTDEVFIRKFENGNGLRKGSLIPPSDKIFPSGWKLIFRVVGVYPRLVEGERLFPEDRYGHYRVKGNYGIEYRDHRSWQSVSDALAPKIEGMLNQLVTIDDWESHWKSVSNPQRDISSGESVRRYILEEKLGRSEVVESLVEKFTLLQQRLQEDEEQIVEAEVLPSFTETTDKEATTAPNVVGTPNAGSSNTDGNSSSASKFANTIERLTKRIEHISVLRKQAGIMAWAAALNEQYMRIDWTKHSGKSEDIPEFSKERDIDAFNSASGGEVLLKNKASTALHQFVLKYGNTNPDLAARQKIEKGTAVFPEGSMTSKKIISSLEPSRGSKGVRKKTKSLSEDKYDTVVLALFPPHHSFVDAFGRKDSRSRLPLPRVLETYPELRHLPSVIVEKGTFQYWSNLHEKMGKRLEELEERRRETEYQKGIEEQSGIRGQVDIQGRQSCSISEPQSEPESVVLSQSRREPGAPSQYFRLSDDESTSGEELEIIDGLGVPEIYRLDAEDEEPNLLMEGGTGEEQEDWFLQWERHRGPQEEQEDEIPQLEGRPEEEEEVQATEGWLAEEYCRQNEDVAKIVRQLDYLLHESPAPLSEESRNEYGRLWKAGNGFLQGQGFQRRLADYDLDNLREDMLAQNPGLEEPVSDVSNTSLSPTTSFPTFFPATTSMPTYETKNYDKDVVGQQMTWEEAPGQEVMQ